MSVLPSFSRVLLSQCKVSYSAAAVYIRHASTATDYKYILTEKSGEKKNVGVITFNRPKVHNAMSLALLEELGSAIKNFDKDESVGAVVITAGEKTFAAGADVKDLANMNNVTALKRESVSLGNISECKKPVIAAVNGLCFGAGCEVAMVCDIIYAGEKALFGQPEISIGVIPGGGGTQRLARAIGKSKAMEMILTATPLSAQEAEKAGLVSKVFPPEKVLPEAIKLGEKISSFSQLTASLCKKAINTCYETPLQQGLEYELSLFSGCFATNDRVEGMKAFIEKRPAKFTNN